MPTIAISGASGQLGRLVARLLLDKGVRPVLISRTPAALDEFAQQGADVRQGDFADPAGLRAALTGVDRLLLISTDIPGPARVALHVNAVEAAKAAGVRHVVYTSLPSPDPDNPAGVAPDHRATEAALVDSGLTWTFLRNNVYAEYQIGTAAQAAASGVLVTNSGKGGTAYVSREDCATTAVAVLTSEGHENTAYDITGSEAIDAATLAALTAEIIGRPVDVVDVDDEGFVQGLIGAGLPAEVAALIASFGAAARGGWVERVSTAVRDLTGSEPKTLREVLTENRAALTG
ncbi:NAD(P)-dependent oxidoreductase [Acrocarpospora corrugata]|uniref:NAD(P)-dependent oxidoreductase n=1 Tax=Acrocarpospora corrugata TaxID=35763 RepID=A0A5M3W1Z7_9ACTN|nr:SDR family oxidoreductase [Acrocarpospora corrugata]GES02736.1 NAD(P)-dependent oxidoreductase [Acrocarpospora corrugata]